jgi:hypothetical protein
MNHCPECGGRVDETSSACPACGKNLGKARAISRLNQTASKRLTQPTTSKVATEVVAQRPTSNPGLSAKGQIWTSTRASGAAPPKAKKVRASAVREPAVEEVANVEEPPAQAPAAPRGRESWGGIGEAEIGEDAVSASGTSGAEAYNCYRCGGPLRFIPEYGRWYCDNCYSYV